MRRSAISPPIRKLIVLTLAICVAGCSPAVGVKRRSPKDVHRALTSNVLSAGDLSEPTRIALRRHNLIDQFNDAPEETLAQLHHVAMSEGVPNEDLFALAELSFLHAEHSGKQSYFLAAGLYAFAFLFPEDATRDPLATDPRYRWACDIYDLAIAQGFMAANSDNFEPRAGQYALPFGVLDVEFDVAELKWGNRRLKDFVPTEELEVRGLRNRYRSPGIGASLAAATELPESEDPADTFVGKSVRVPLTAVLLLDRPRQQLQGSELHARLRLVASTDAEVVDIGVKDVPLETDRTAALAATLSASGMLDSELSEFLGRAVGVHSEAHLGAGWPFRHGRIPVVFVHGTNSSPARWADMVNDLEEDDWVRQRFQFWFFSYDSGNPIIYSSMLLRRALRQAIQHFDPDGKDACVQHMIVIGHSQGGLLTKMTAIDSGSRFWDNISSRPPEEIPVSDQTRALLREAMFVQPLPFVNRVIFISTPHRGSYLAGPQLVRRLAQSLIEMPSALLKTGGTLLTLQDNTARYFRLERIPTSIDNMSPSNRFILTIASIPVAPGVHAHSIISVEGNGPPESGGDGVVKYASAHIDGVESERVVRSPHSCQSNPDTIDEVRRILRLHAAEVTCDPELTDQDPQGDVEGWLR